MMMMLILINCCDRNPPARRSGASRPLNANHESPIHFPPIQHAAPAKSYKTPQPLSRLYFQIIPFTSATFGTGLHSFEGGQHPLEPLWGRAATRSAIVRTVATALASRRAKVHHIARGAVHVQAFHQYDLFSYSSSVKAFTC